MLAPLVGVAPAPTELSGANPGAYRRYGIVRNAAAAAAVPVGSETDEDTSSNASFEEWLTRQRLEELDEAEKKEGADVDALYHRHG